MLDDSKVGFRADQRWRERGGGAQAATDDAEHCSGTNDSALSHRGMALEERVGSFTLSTGGGRGIRTPGTLPGTVVFKTTAIDHSAIPPRRTLARIRTISALAIWPQNGQHGALTVGRIREVPAGQNLQPVAVSLDVSQPPACGARPDRLSFYRWTMPFYARLGFEAVPFQQISPALRAIVADETRRGLDPLRRVVMRRSCAHS
jgi:hypothetical protein